MSDLDLLKYTCGRTDLSLICDLIDPGSSVLDLGCGDGLFLRYLKERKNVRSLGLEISAEKIASCIANGVPVIQGDLDSRMEFAADGDFDYVILSRTLQEVRHPENLLDEIVRVGKQAIVSFINFGYFEYRFELFFCGRMPRGRHLPYEWFNTPNIHLGTLTDFHTLCRERHIRIVSAEPLGRIHGILPKWCWPNLFAHSCVFVLEKEK
ncbi:MAG: methionine biosynthesis protein MetW [Victivallaceae bacterium]|nr:methionine biosynthesis protein MetW [Victivallaceae bacterium]